MRIIDMAEFIPEMAVVGALLWFAPESHIALALVAILAILAWKRKNIPPTVTMSASTPSVSREEFESLKNKLNNFQNMLGIKMSHERQKTTT